MKKYDYFFIHNLFTINLLTNATEYGIIRYNEREVHKMKIQITITEEERKNTANIIMVDPCSHIKCSGINCEQCPLKENAEILRDEQERFMRVLNEIEVANDD